MIKNVADLFTISLSSKTCRLKKALIDTGLALRSESDSKFKLNDYSSNSLFSRGAQ